jgi:hypothetical protein
MVDRPVVGTAVVRVEAETTVASAVGTVVEAGTVLPVVEMAVVEVEAALEAKTAEMAELVVPKASPVQEEAKRHRHRPEPCTRRS